MACRRFGAKPLSEPTLAYRQVDWVYFLHDTPRQIYTFLGFAFVFVVALSAVRVPLSTTGITWLLALLMVFINLDLWHRMASLGHSKFNSWNAKMFRQISLVILNDIIWLL